jgi:hypothetical protein
MTIDYSKIVREILFEMRLIRKSLEANLTEEQRKEYAKSVERSQVLKKYLEEKDS